MVLTQSLLSSRFSTRKIELSLNPQEVHSFLPATIKIHQTNRVHSQLYTQSAVSVFISHLTLMSWWQALLLFSLVLCTNATGHECLSRVQRFVHAAAHCAIGAYERSWLTPSAFGIHIQPSNIYSIDLVHLCTLTGCHTVIEFNFAFCLLLLY